MSSDRSRHGNNHRHETMSQPGTASPSSLTTGPGGWIHAATSAGLSNAVGKWLRSFDGGRFIAAELFLALATVACFANVQSDTWWHLAAGREMVRTGKVMLTEQFSHTAFGGPWANYEWLSQWVFFQVYHTGGMPLLAATCALALFGACLFTWSLMRGPIADRLLVLALAVPLATPSWSVRPQAFTLFLLGLTAYLIVRERFWPLPLVFLIWANLHGAVALGFVVLLGDLAVAIATRRDVPRRLIFGSLCFAATLLTPLGLRYWPEIVRSLQRSRVNRIAEWQPPTLSPEYAVFWLVVGTLFWLAITRWRRLESYADRVLLMMAVFVFPLAVRAMRNIGPFALVAVPAVARLAFHQAVTRPVAQAEHRVTSAALRVLVLAVSLTVALFLVLHRWTMSPPPGEWRPVSDQAAAVIRGCPGPIYNHYNDGGYLIWFTPEQKVFLDSRQDPYPAELLQAQLEVERTGDYRALLDRYSVRCAVLRPNSSALSVLKQSGWSEDYRDSRWIVVRSPALLPQK